VDGFAVDLQLLRTVLLPDVSLCPGRELMARVVTNDAGRGGLSIAGMLVEAELPEELQAGDELRLQVRELSTYRVVFGIQPDPNRTQPQRDSEAELTAPLPPPGTRSPLLVQERPSSHADASDPTQRTHTLALRYDTPSAGPVDMYFVLAPGALHLQLTLAAGDPFEAAETTREVLRESLRASAGRAVTITVKPRFDPVDVYV
jgi:hypothetical protein